MDLAVDGQTAPGWLHSQMKAWREDLLALDRRQKLLYFQHPKVGSLEFVQPAMGEIERWLERGRVHLQPAAPEPGTPQPAKAAKSRTATVLDKDDAALQATCRRLHQRSEQEYADRGVWILYVGLGMLNWVDPADGKPASSPLKLVPVRLERTGSTFALHRTRDEAQVNSALALKMQRDFGIELPAFEDPDFTVEELTTQLRDAIAGEPDWSIDARSILMTFTFHKEAMYKDLADNEAQILASPLIQAMVLGPDAGQEDNLAFELADDASLDDLVPPETLHSILDADSSQRKCIIAAREGRSFVMDGPPGTGKSQTIANIIAELMAVGKTVLFVSEKAAALDVVRDRLAAQNLSPFLLELHSHKATRKHVVQALSRELSQRPVGRHTLDPTDRSRLESAREELSGYAAAMNEVRLPLGRSLHSVLGRLAQLSVHEQIPTGERSRFATLDAELLGVIQRRSGELSRAWRPAAEGTDFTWRGLAGDQPDAGGVRDAAGAALDMADLSQNLSDQALNLDSRLPFLDVPLSRSGVEQRLAVLDLLARRPQTPDGWLGGDFDAVESRVRGWLDSVELRKQLEATINTSFAAWTPADHAMAAELKLTIRNTETVPVPGGIGQATVERAAALQQEIRTITAEIQALEADAAQIAALFRTDPAALGMRKLRVLCALAAMSQAGNRPEADWLDTSVHASLEEGVLVLGGATAKVLRFEQQLQATFTPDVLNLDLEGLADRFAHVHDGFFSRWSAAARADRNTLRASTPRGTVNREVIDALPAAMAWRDALQELYAAERTYGPRLKSYYQGLHTDFGRIRQAIDLAREASVVAGDDVGLDGLAAQLSTNTEPDRLLMPIANAITERLDRIERLMGASLDPDFRGWAQNATLAELAHHTGDFATRLAAADSALARLTAMGAAPLTLTEAVGALDSIGRLVVLDARNRACAAADSALLGHRFAGLATDWAALEHDLAWCREARRNLQAPLDATALGILGGFTGVGPGLATAAAAWDSGLERLAEHFEPERHAGLAAELGRDLSETVELAQAMHQSAATDIDAWFEFKRLRDWAVAHGLGDAVAGLEAAGAPAPDVPGALERAALEPWAESVVAADGRLAEYRSGNRDALVAEFRALDEKLIRSAYSSVVQACAARRPRTSIGAAAVIVREAEKKTRHKPIRTILEQAGGVAQALKPCFMMSPLSVSQYLPGNMRFDVVIFDEASQVMPADAVNCIYRGSQLIVAGDQKQLPPTAFFTTVAGEGDDEEAPDAFDSVLDLCKASGAITSLPLAWHYRSLHEDLITYSNYGFYEGRLNTFPGAVQESPELGVHHEYVDGVYLRGAGAKNPIEAERVVDRVIAHRTQNTSLSLGVVTFSTAQADAIFDAIERRALAEPALAGLLDDRDRLHGFFVKNLESVQGDERDIIIFSVGYGPDENGTFAMNFGPLTRRGGQRRLNVAITRARRRVEIVSSFHAAQILEGTSEGNRHLKNYLDFAARGSVALGLDAAADGVGEAGFLLESQVRAAIESLGYETVPRVGSAGYRVDIGVKHPHQPGTFLLGVECDGGTYSSAKTARDRDRLRAAVLGNLGWSMLRVWGLAWYRDPAGQRALLRDALEQALAGTTPAVRPDSVQTQGAPALDFEDVDLFGAPDWTVEYRQAQFTRTGTHQPGSPAALPELVAFCTSVIGLEAPLHLDTLQARLRDTWDVGSIGTRIRANLLEAVGRTSVDGVFARLDNDSFIRLGPPGAVAVRRTGPGGVPRRAGAIPPEEFDAAVELVLRDSMGASADQVLAALRRVFSWSRSGPDIQAAVSKSLYRCVARGLCAQDAEGIYRLLSP